MLRLGCVATGWCRPSRGGTKRRTGALVPATPPPAASRVLSASRSAACRFDGGDVDLPHFHHRLERALGGRTVGIGGRVDQRPRRDLPGQAPSVLAPPARALGTAVFDDGVPVAVCLGLVVGDDLK